MTIEMTLEEVDRWCDLATHELVAQDGLACAPKRFWELAALNVGETSQQVFVFEVSQLDAGGRCNLCFTRRVWFEQDDEEVEVLGFDWVLVGSEGSAPRAAISISAAGQGEGRGRYGDLLPWDAFCEAVTRATRRLVDAGLTLSGTREPQDCWEV